MTPREIAIARAFANVSFPPATAAKRFARHMTEIAVRHPEHPLTQKQADYMAKVAWRYRRQIPVHLTYPVVDDGSVMAAAGEEVSQPRSVERPLSIRDQRKAEREGRAPKALPAPAAQEELPL
jgi:hypothetical protein